MAFSKPVGGDRFNLITGNCKPWKPNAAYTAAVPVKGDLVKQDTAGSGVVALAAAGDTPFGMVFSLNNGNGILSILELRDCDLLLEYQGTFAIGDKIVANGSVGTIAIGGVLRNQVKHDNTNGVGTVIEKDQRGTGLATVRFF